MNLCYHKEDFYLNTEWHYWATANGKGPCDGVRRTIKRKTSRASLQRPIDNQITPQEFHEWASELSSLPSIAVRLSPANDYTIAKEKLDLRYKTAKSIAGTQKFHCIIPTANGNIRAKEYSNSNNERICKLFKKLCK